MGYKRKSTRCSISSNYCILKFLTPLTTTTNYLFQNSNESKNQTKIQKLLGYLRPGQDDEEGSFDVSFAGLFRCMFCTHKKPDTLNTQLMHISTALSDLNLKMKNLEM